MAELSNVEVIHLIQELKRLEKEKAPKKERTEIFNRIPVEFRVKICLGCGEEYYGCDCPAGSAEHLRSSEEITTMLQRRKDIRK